MNSEKKNFPLNLKSTFINILKIAFFIKIFTSGRKINFLIINN
jgi:hypothetical protein